MCKAGQLTLSAAAAPLPLPRTPPPPLQPTISRAEPDYVLSQCSTALLRRYLIANVAINPVKRLHPKITPPSVISATGSVCFWSADDAIDNVQVVRGVGGGWQRSWGGGKQPNSCG